jgi:transcriptional regulator GlxA family with amidase domain
MDKARIAILAYDGCLASELFGFRDVLAYADQFAKARAVTRLETSIVTLDGKDITTSGGETLRGTRPTLAASDLVVVPGFAFLSLQDITPRVSALKDEIAAIAGAARRGKRIASICVGSFVLGAAGLLSNRKATTAWHFADHLAHMYPTAAIERDSLIVEDGPVITTGAFSAAHDLALHVAARYTAADVVSDTRRVTLIDAVRSSQAPFVDHRLITARSTKFTDRVEKRLLSKLGEPYSLEATARAVGTSPRTLLRKFKAERGQTPLSFLQAARVDRAKRLLEQTDMSIDEIAAYVGYNDVSAFRTLFHNLCGIPPGAFRKRFAPAATRRRAS